VALMGESASPAEDPAEGGIRLVIDVGSVSRAIEAKLRQHRADHGVIRRGPKVCRKAA
jgi:hypothetical protein